MPQDMVGKRLHSAFPKSGKLAVEQAPRDLPKAKERTVPAFLADWKGWRQDG